MEETVWSLIPPIIAIVMVLLTKRVLLSLGVGILAAALFLGKFQVGDSLKLVWEAFKGVFVVDGALDTWNVFILLFVLMLGMLTALVTMMGGTRSFAEWMIRRVKTRTGAQLMTVLFGVIIFVDDYFNSLTVGQIAKPVTDKQRISRAKLAYLVDSTSAPVSVVAPVSSWGAYIIGIIGTVLATHQVTEYGAFQAFLQMIPMNYYVWAALGVVVVIAIKQIDFGPMKVHEQRALETGEVLNPAQKETIDVASKLPVSEVSKRRDLLLPMITLFIATIIAIFVDGLRKVEGEKTWINILGSADVSLALFVGGSIGMVLTMILFYQHIRAGKLSYKNFITGAITGAKSMMPAFGILIFAWAIAALISQLGTGVYLASVVEAANLSVYLLPLIVFLMAGFIAFSTGTSWGAFGILLPIAGEIAATTDVTLMLPILAAVLAGAVFGDHCSPISDTTILSSTGSSCHHIDHVTTQIPYALLAACIAGLGYIVFGFTESVLLGLVMVLVSLIGLFIGMRKRKVTET
ncbi:Na+/H+ antiporter NhaC family protein [Virgibacillus pantothenticus]|uniref:Sodium:proton antiporter n=1 Tax=Virgibacillus pantothenticus TaxID=1473 RepID=A0A0L0QKE1_VIRPA|nr:Na+/H+ antiporter NhaC family protein [Virgibacillus pantothenticus]KNE19095.1 sodium:proton antiporter [Virgibacillus pantothenticus]QTY15547.1 Na+/H+ antiporter NhaC family protein [Virgibacillus pantothenticus]SIT00140.1 Na+/H+ antiporter NhaC [Virgibacillus pantothenticus]